MAMAGRPNPFPEDRPAHLDDVVFLPAALTRLVIDPYREACSTKTAITRCVEVGPPVKNRPRVILEQPFLFTGFDSAPLPVKQALARAIHTCGCAYLGRQPLVDAQTCDLPGTLWFQLLLPGDLPSPQAHAHIHQVNGSALKEIRNILPAPQHAEQLTGLCVDSRTLPSTLPHALEKQFDILLLDTVAGITRPWTELNHTADLSLLRDTVLRLRSMNKEEEICLLHFGGLRSGTDVAKSLALNCRASVFGTAMALALGGTIQGDTIDFSSPPLKGSAPPTPETTEEALYQAAVNWIKGSAQETAVIARCAGKTDVHNLEPEDIRAITIATSEALGIPLTSGAVGRKRF